jgi:hypothetical protein
VLHTFHAMWLFKLAHNQRLKFFHYQLRCNTVARLPYPYMPFLQGTFCLLYPALSSAVHYKTAPFHPVKMPCGAYCSIISTTLI